MITPISDESEWTDYLTGLPEWQLPAQRTLVVAPHPDDETLAVGGLIAMLRLRGVEVDVIAITDGENAYPDDATPDMSRLGATREMEQANALAILGVDEKHIHRFRLPDSNVAAHERQLVEGLLNYASSNTHIVAPWRNDFHPDHESAGRAAEKVSSLTGASLTSYFFWTWHRAQPSFLSSLQLTSLGLGRDAQHKKQAALQCHKSQLEHSSGQPILPDHLLAPARRSFEVMAIG